MMRFLFPGKTCLIFYLFLLFLFYAYIGIIIETMNWQQSLVNLYMLPIYYDMIILFFVSLGSLILIVFTNKRKNIFKSALFFLLLSMSLITLKQTAHIVEVVSFYKNPKEIAWALRFNFDDNYVPKYEKVNAPLTKEHILNKQSHNPDDQMYFSPSGEYRVEYFLPEDGSGFYIIKNVTNDVKLKVSHWLINPTVIKWAFNEKYIIFEYKYSDEDMSKTLVTNINTGRSVFL